jgi:hypothetical protein
MAYFITPTDFCPGEKLSASFFACHEVAWHSHELFPFFVKPGMTTRKSCKMIKMGCEDEIVSFHKFQ